MNTVSKYIIDRFEDIYAVCEDEQGSMTSIPMDQLPPDCAEGSHLYRDSDGIYHLQAEGQKISEDRIQEKWSRLFDTSSES